MTRFVCAPAAALLAASLLGLASAAAAAKPAAAKPAAPKPVPAGSVCGTIRLDTAYGGPVPKRLADVVQLAAVTADGRIVGRVRFGREKVRDTFHLLPYAIAGLPPGRPLTLAAAVRAPAAPPQPAASAQPAVPALPSPSGFVWAGRFAPGANTPHGAFAVKPGRCVHADYALELLEAPPASASPSPAPPASSGAPLPAPSPAPQR